MRSCKVIDTGGIEMLKYVNRKKKNKYVAKKIFYPLKIFEIFKKKGFSIFFISNFLVTCPN